MLGAHAEFNMTGTQHVPIREAGEADFDTWFALYEAVAAEGRWIVLDESSPGSPYDEPDAQELRPPHRALL
jgi:hypothetical protein